MRVWRGKKGEHLTRGRAFLLSSRCRGEGLWQEVVRTPESAGFHFIHEK